MADCAWVAQLLQYGLLAASFIPPARQRELRDLTRQRSQLGAEQTAVANRIQKVLEDANVKFGSVATDVLGVSGRAILAAIVSGQDDPRRWPSWPGGGCGGRSRSRVRPSAGG